MRQILFALALILSPLSLFAQDGEREGGIIGTGIYNTGIFGTITALGSIYVNGQHVLLDPVMPVASAASDMTASDLRPGHIVAIVVVQAGDVWQALHIRQIMPLLGPVEALSETHITVLGTQVELSGPLSAELGDWVAVSGLWRAQTVVASLVETVAEPPFARISGSYFGTNEDGNDLIGDTVIIGLQTEHLREGDFVRAIGHPVPGGLEVTALETDMFGGAVGIVQAKGYLSAPRPSGLYTVLGTGLVAYTDMPAMINTQISSIRCGENGGLGGLDPEDSERQELLTSLNCWN
ncbi:MAG: hypothetical protein JKX69_15365 [Rhodobacteraceae bacterium]|nr:hypothetical protein [Paracoccaceae bacterium]PHR54557.1 MAG: hypothetical protein COA47_15350 [Robiginitomaculum sp.]